MKGLDEHGKSDKFSCKLSASKALPKHFEAALSQSFEVIEVLVASLSKRLGKL